MNKLTPSEKLKHMVVLEAIRLGQFEYTLTDRTSENILEAYYEMTQQDAHWDAMETIRSGGIETGTNSTYSRNF